MDPNILALKAVLESTCGTQTTNVRIWHERGLDKLRPADLSNLCVPPELKPDESVSLPNLRNLILADLFYSFCLWNLERAATDSDLAEYRRCCDKLNQKRAACLFRVDLCLEALLKDCRPPAGHGHARDRHNTETLGAALDRLAFMAIRIYHAQEEAQRSNADSAADSQLKERLAVLREQHRDLLEAILDLVDDYGTGRKAPKTYRRPDQESMSMPASVVAQSASPALAPSAGFLPRPCAIIPFSASPVEISGQASTKRASSKTTATRATSKKAAAGKTGDTPDAAKSAKSSTAKRRPSSGRTSARGARNDKST